MLKFLLPPLVAVFSLPLSGCENKALKEMEAVKNKICACTDQACAKALDAEFEAQQAKTAELVKDDQEKAIEISLEAIACATALSK